MRRALLVLFALATAVAPVGCDAILGIHVTDGVAEAPGPDAPAPDADGAATRATFDAPSFSDSPDAMVAPDEGAVLSGDGSASPDGFATDADAGRAVDASAASPFAVAVGLGLGSSCALLEDGTVWCWGSDTAGGLGLGDDAAAGDAVVYTPAQVPDVLHAVALAVGESHACALLDGGVVTCWGSNDDGQAGGNGSGPDLDSPTPVVNLTLAGAGAMGTITAGRHHTCAVGQDGTSVWCWGSYAGLYDEVPVTRVGALAAPVAEMAAGYGVTCARLVGGAVQCWGVNTSGVLGQGDGDASTSLATPTTVDLDASILQIAIGEFHVCAVTDAHELLCWGENVEHQLGPIADTSALQVPSPTPVMIGGHVLKVGCEIDTTCALFDDGGTSCWGYDYDDELGTGTAGQISISPVGIPSLGPATNLFAGSETACATLAAGGLACWGNDQSGQLGGGVLPALPYGAFPVTF